MSALVFHAIVTAAMLATLIALLVREVRGCGVCGCDATTRCGCVCHRRGRR